MFDSLSVLIDNHTSWIWLYIEDIKLTLFRYSHNINIFKNHQEIVDGDIMFILSCDKIIKQQGIQKHKHNIVIHESALPIGKGWSPLTWQVEEGKNEIPITLFEASTELDSGDIYLRDTIFLSGDELIAEIREKQIHKTIEMIDHYLRHYPMPSIQQDGHESFYPRRTIKDNELPVDKSISVLFNKMRVADNDRYPLHFKMLNKRYILKIYKDESETISNSSTP
ncbi:MAG: methionyl-tRNA formyltransferase [Nitrospirae bacterium]|nr:methionyl-tRNA formyltransferase [Nitrospirota bacterium]